MSDNGRDPNRGKLSEMGPEWSPGPEKKALSFQPCLAVDCARSRGQEGPPMASSGRNWPSGPRAAASTSRLLNRSTPVWGRRQRPQACNVLLLRSGLGLERERGYSAEARARALEPVGIEHLHEFRLGFGLLGLRIGFRGPRKHPFRNVNEHPKLQSGGQELFLGTSPRISKIREIAHTARFQPIAASCCY